MNKFSFASLTLKNFTKYLFLIGRNGGNKENMNVRNGKKTCGDNHQPQVCNLI